MKSASWGWVKLEGDKAAWHTSLIEYVRLLSSSKALGCKTFFMLNSAINKICSAYKKSKTSDLNFLPAQQNWAWNFSC